MNGLFSRWLGPAARRRRLAARAPAGPLRDCLEAPLPDERSDLRQLRCLALDLETTGGDPARDAILSFGWVALDALRIDLSSACHRLVRIDGAVSPGSAVIHRITDDQTQSGMPLAEALDELLAALRGRVLIAHHARTELGFVAAACRKAFGSGIEIPALDTLAIAARRHRQAAPGELRLEALRRRYGLPRYPVHHALSDALACAELFLALVAAQDAPLPFARHRVRQGPFG
jgi:DNA polymerase-3 subunit epsilon